MLLVALAQRRFLSCLTCVVGLVGIACSPAKAAGPEPPNALLTGPLEIRAERMEANRDDRTILFDGQVRAFRQDLVILCDRLEVALAVTGDEIEEVRARGAVRISRGELLASSDEALLSRGGVVTLEGSPLLRQGANRVQGRRIVLDLATGRFQVEGGVTATILPASLNRPKLPSGSETNPPDQGGAGDEGEASQSSPTPPEAVPE
jgi:lipopolysaccharide export system protein LptA